MKTPPGQVYFSNKLFEGQDVMMCLKYDSWLNQSTLYVKQKSDLSMELGEPYVIIEWGNEIKV